TSGRSRRSTGTATTPSTTPSTNGVNTASGPNSNTVSTPAARTATTLSAKRTGSRTCRTQYPGSHHNSAVARPPLTSDTPTTPHARNDTDPNPSANRSNTGSTAAEWNA